MKKNTSKEKKIKFMDSTIKHDNGFIEDVVIAYADVTAETKNIIGSMVKNAKLIVDQCSKDATLSVWKNRWQGTTIEVSDNHISVDGLTLEVELSNGNKFSFYTSEWGWIHKNK